MSEYLRVEGLLQSWPDFRLEVSFSAHQGEFITVLGPSGCGKTTLLRLIAGLDEADGGSVYVDGIDILRLKPEKRGIGFVFQDLALFPHLSVQENVAYGLRVQGYSGKELHQAVELALQNVNLAGFGKRRVQTLSGGERQRVAIARSLAPKPRLLLLDEPLSSLDAPLRKRMALELREMVQNGGVTALHVTHDQAEAFSLSDRILVMNQGRIEASGTPDDFRSGMNNDFARGFLSL
jgi:ABC-type Fe3+/spermidine/putrescine transport system ATPase subunit